MPAIKPPHQPDPYSGYNFYVEWNGILHAGFQECSGLGSTQNAGEYREGTDPPTKRKLPGLVSYSNITLRRGITNNDELWKWRENVMRTGLDRRSISIVMLDHTGQEKIRWNLSNCWPTTWNGPSMNATSDETAIESLELVHEGISVDTWS
ncbi:phage tail protein [Nostoc parmelioides]|uniref:Phage tail protein n=1 Tax=Nostoc parmelioides FACHB-3921 TaxID=2692909 RepID=A0ABR8BDV0_9NOSO|nr:phage tail protein [Nostoc parmelioides]MBD2251986.1 phage tail protein [Nostoc parmelioides FACHB-3921]